MSILRDYTPGPRYCMRTGPLTFPNLFEPITFTKHGIDEPETWSLTWGEANAWERARSRIKPVIIFDDITRAKCVLEDAAVTRIKADKLLIGLEPEILCFDWTVEVRGHGERNGRGLVAVRLIAKDMKDNLESLWADFKDGFEEE